MIKVSKLADYGTVLMVFLARHRDDLFNARDLAQKTHIALPTVSKLLKLLSKAGLLTSQRGAKGGYQLAQDPEDITVVDILFALDGKFAMTDCSEQTGLCFLEPHCSIKTNWKLISRTIYHALECITLADMAKPMQKNQIQISKKEIQNRGNWRDSITE